MQTCLEKKGIEAREKNTVRSDYNKNDIYSESHENALSNGDSKGKGTGKGGHTHSLPNCNKPSAIDYSTFSTENGGGLYDIEGKNGKGGRKFLQNISLYNPGNEYGINSIDTSANLADGQIII